jgi:uncharacterized RDD family membrane protein YckC
VNERLIRGDPTQVITRRAVGLLVDAFLITVLPVLTVLVVGHASTVRECPDRLARGRSCFVWRGNGVVVENRSIILFLVVFALSYVLVFVVVQGRTGASPGKALLGVRVVDRRGARPGVGRSAIRAVAWVIDGISLLVPVALWAAWFTPGHRRVGDLLAGTFVVRHGTEASLAAAALDSTSPGPVGLGTNSG